jgi:asparagine synthase (glutamine-hydrolysing)
MDPELAREGLERLQPLRRLAHDLRPDPGSDVGRVCVLESAHYMRNQLLRDADWAGMAHGLEIRTPLVDYSLLTALAPALASLIPGTGKAALAGAAERPLPMAVTDRAKTGFGVPTGAWMNDLAGHRPRKNEPSRGLVSRDWSRLVLDALGGPQVAVAA